HLEHLKLILDLFDKVGLAVNPKKTFVRYPSINILGFTIDGYGKAITEERVEAIRKLKMPETLGALETYIGMTSYLSHYIPYYAQKIKPL
ncbi:uncharacterized protein BCR38DRAFT_328165, partial [Pseudomassariella vexata]